MDEQEDAQGKGKNPHRHLVLRGKQNESEKRMHNAE
jgi:hypothetical protein